MTNGEEISTQPGKEFVSIRKLIVFVLIGAVVYLAILFYLQIDPVIAAISSLPYWILPALMTLSFLNYLIRYVKWQYYLRRIDVNLGHADSLSIFLAGFTLTTTPGKMGEAVKGVFINDIDGTPLAKTAPVVVSERATDLIAMIILALVGFIIGFTGGDQLYLVVLLGAAAVVGAVILGRSEFYDKILQRLTSFGPLKKFLDDSNLIVDTMTKTMAPKPMAVSTAISVPGWFMECMALWLLLSILSGAGVPTLSQASLILLLQATFIHATASAIGAVSFLPGGLIAYEGTAVILIPLLLGFTESQAGVAIIIIRFVTLWFSVVVGFIALAVVERRRRTREQNNSPQA
ncbi:MAG: lysylphosphatidylglycerol synthase transmembrane domain-containing protein [Candidatus Thorarchaeota archaeon]